MLISAVSAGGADLADYPQASRLWLCHVNGTLTATKRAAVAATGTGNMRMLVANHATLEKGQVYAIFRPERLELERESLALDQSLLESKIREARLDQEDKTIVLRAQKGEAEAELQELSAAMTLQEIKTNPAFGKKIAESISAVRKKIQHFEERLAVLEQNMDDDVEVVKLKLEQRRREQDFENIKRTTEQRSPFEGSFELTDELAGKFSERAIPYDFPVEAAEPIGHITDSSSYEVTLAEYPPILNSAPLEKLVMEIQPSGSATPLTARFLETKYLGAATTVSNRQRALVFQIQAEDRTRAESLAGSSPFGQIFQNLPDACHLVPKAELMRLLEDRKKTENGGWASLARAVWPDAELVATGHRDIALKLAEKPVSRGAGTGQ